MPSDYENGAKKTIDISIKAEKMTAVTVLLPAENRSCLMPSRCLRAGMSIWVSSGMVIKSPVSVR